MSTNDAIIDVSARSDSAPGVLPEFAASSPLKIAFFGHDANESTIRKRVKALQAAGAHITGLMFSRRRNGVIAAPDWTNVDLGVTEDGYYGRRFLQLIAAIGKLWQNRKLLRDADIIYARNIDMLLMARVAKAMSGSKAPLVYEALDVHPAMTRTGGLGSILRYVERRLLSSSSLLVVSSPMFIDKYFLPLQGYRGPWFLLENKLIGGEKAPEIIVRRKTASASPTWTIGWFGVIRCERSLEMLQRLADQMPERLIVHIRGIPSERDGITQERLEKICAGTGNVFYFGKYKNPDDLPDMYGAVDLTWAVDFSASGANSDWLIPNRIYEGGLYGVPAIARRATATGDIVEKDGSGWCFDEPFEKELADFLRTLDQPRYSNAVETLRSKDRSAFVDVSDTANLVVRLASLAQKDRASRSAS